MTIANPEGRGGWLPSPVAAWRGKGNLFVVFWGYGVLLSGVLIAAFVSALYRGDAMLQQLLLGVFAIYTAWVLVSVWRCAVGARQPWSMLAQLLTVAWAGNSLLVLGFLQLRLLEAWL
jgi:hypothetical protein